MTLEMDFLMEAWVQAVAELGWPANEAMLDEMFGVLSSADCLGGACGAIEAVTAMSDSALGGARRPVVVVALLHVYAREQFGGSIHLVQQHIGEIIAVESSRLASSAEFCSLVMVAYGKRTPTTPDEHLVAQLCNQVDAVAA